MVSTIRTRPQEARIEIGRRLREARERADLSHRVAADELREWGQSLNYNSIGDYERGRTSPRLDRLILLCRLYDASPLWVITGIRPERWSELPDSIDEPRTIAFQSAVERFAAEIASASRAAGVYDDVAESWVKVGERLAEYGDNGGSE